MGITEEAIIRLLHEVFPQSHPDLRLGMGDDAAIFTGSASQVITIDTANEGTHFKREWSPARSIGARVVAANIADLLSMNAKPQFLLVALTLTGDEEITWVRALAEGIAEEALKSGAVIIGGDTTRGAALSITITAIGRSENPIMRAGAQAGDDVFISSLTGWSAAGLHLFENSISINSSFAEYAISQYQSPEIDYEIDYSRASSMADISDGLMIQAGQIAQASGVRIEIDAELMRNSEEFAQLEELARECSVDLLQWISQGGEDHVLLATGSDLPGIRIGRVVAGTGAAVFKDGVEIKMAPVAWDHFKKS